MSTKNAIVLSTATTSLDQITGALGVPRNLFPDDAEIERLWGQLPRLLNEIPPAYRSEHHVRMCVAVASGLFDAAINYIWNSAILRLRDRVRAFGFNMAAQVLGKPFDEKALTGLKDADLLSLCLQLNLITEDAFFFLDQCRDIRNSFSSAHPAIGKVDDAEVLVFLTRCTKYALAESFDPRGIDSATFVKAVKASKFSVAQKNEWVQRFRDTHDAQRQILVGMLHGIYCDPASGEEARLNALELCKGLAGDLSSSVTSRLLNQHAEYVAAGDEKRQSASRGFFKALGLLELLTTSEKHSIISHATARLWSIHLATDNFYNEPPFAEALASLASQMAIPPSAQKEYVETVVACAIGNLYGVAWNAEPHYRAMVRGFSSREVAFMLEAAENEKSTIGHRVRISPDCRKRFKNLVALLDPQTVPASHKKVAAKWQP